MTRFDDVFAAFGVPALEHQFGESVKYIARRTDARGDSFEAIFASVTARRREQTIKEQPLGIVTTSPAPMIWNIAASFFTNNEFFPERGDVIQDAGGNCWTVVGWKQTGLQADYEFTCERGEV